MGVPMVQKLQIAARRTDTVPRRPKVHADAHENMAKPWRTALPTLSARTPLNTLNIMESTNGSDASPFPASWKFCQFEVSSQRQRDSPSTCTVGAGNRTQQPVAVVARKAAQTRFERDGFGLGVSFLPVFNQGKFGRVDALVLIRVSGAPPKEVR